MDKFEELEAGRVSREVRVMIVEIVALCPLKGGRFFKGDEKSSPSDLKYESEGFWEDESISKG
ncbi:hypothetical protein GCM10011339_05190 [Echinicola rosea]|uniref:Uncharacterized protein n=1 Tax=Echinicola rosea TaxID=1807691 RepID=A0ABQ1UME7_9BACT|nr:hypothetical protein GCM10011339_05190 [Echinicola rosea]